MVLRQRGLNYIRPAEETLDKLEFFRNLVHFCLLLWVIFEIFIHLALVQINFIFISQLL